MEWYTPLVFTCFNGSALANTMRNIRKSGRSSSLPTTKQGPRSAQWTEREGVRSRSLRGGGGGGGRWHAPPENLWNLSPLNNWKCIRNFEDVTFCERFVFWNGCTFVKKIKGMDQVPKVGGSSPPSPCEGITFRGSAYFLNASQNNWNKLQAEGTYYMQSSGRYHEHDVSVI